MGTHWLTGGLITLVRRQMGGGVGWGVGWGLRGRKRVTERRRKREEERVAEAEDDKGFSDESRVIGRRQRWGEKRETEKGS